MAACRLALPSAQDGVADLFDMRARALRRDRAARAGVELFLYERAFSDCLERIGLIDRRFRRALLIGCPDPNWAARLRALLADLEIRDPGPLFAASAGGKLLIEDEWEPLADAYDLVLAIGTLDSVNDLPLALRLIRHAMQGDALFIGAVSGGETLPQLRGAMRVADALAGVAAPHVHPRIDASSLAPLLSDSGFVRPVVDVDRASVAYSSLDRLVSDLRQMGTTNVLSVRPHFIGKAARAAAYRAFADAGDGGRTIETFEVLHFAAWTASNT